ncbi:sulfonate transport system permease protein [Paenibacillus cellulosilyticus]|uniref:Sulfonate transport system permease protein n=1 Tax=Paenibacillus cellulosilyticus TaxID=375489 RepID=A0A2V2Z0B1_9BACL|nr:ABC transporter permease [Paenibacillus cellulosilyticus]PWW08708.1 sulfonate transport system permease protein [Paenibacillus cellulosilyticus]QKS48274.1 ABC transporter permease [Paenibacillus cellulosilyticus]
MSDVTLVSKAGKKKASIGKARRAGLPNWLYGWVLPVIVLALWEAASALGLVSDSALPAPSKIAKAFWQLALTGALADHVTSSAIRAGGGFLLGGATGLLLGIFTGLGKWAEKTLDPTIQMLRTVPLLTLIPLFILWFGVGEFSKVLLIALGSFFPLYFHTHLGVRSADRKLYEVTRILQYSKLHLLTKLIIPAALPNILLGIRLSVGASWLLLAVAEMMGASAGVGYMIQDARVYAQTDIVFVGIILFALVGKLSDSVVRLVEKRCLRWNNSYKG